MEGREAWGGGGGRLGGGGLNNNLRSREAKLFPMWYWPGIEPLGG